MHSDQCDAAPIIEEQEDAAPSTDELTAVAPGALVAARSETGSESSRCTAGRRPPTSEVPTSGTIFSSGFAPIYIGSSIVHQRRCAMALPLVYGLGSVQARLGRTCAASRERGVPEVVDADFRYDHTS